MSELLYFEDVRIGQRWQYGRYEVTAEEIVAFAREFDPQPFHLDDEAARATLFGGLVASGWHTGSMFIRMAADHLLPGLAAQGAVGFDDLRWLKPVRPGDVLSVESEIVRKEEPSKRPHLGTVHMASRIINQRGEVVMSLVSLVLFTTSAPAGAEPRKRSG